MNAISQFPIPQLSRRQKAAVIVRLLHSKGIDLPLSALPDDLQSNLTQEMGGLGLVARDTMEKVLMEFAQSIDRIGMSVPRSLSAIATEFEGKLSPTATARLRAQMNNAPQNPWDRLGNLGPEALCDLCQSESPQVAAVLLTKIATKTAAEVLGRLDPPLARAIAYAITQTEDISPTAVEQIAQGLIERIDDVPPRAFDAAPAGRIGAILNVAPAVIRDDVLTGLGEADPDLKAAVEATIFTFAHIPTKLQQSDMAKLTKAIDGDLLTTALAAAFQTGYDEAAEFILAGLSKRMAETLREEIQERPQLKSRAAESALSEVVSIIRNLLDQGEITLIEPDEE